MSSLMYYGSFIEADGYGRVATDIVETLLDRGWDIFLGDINSKKVTIPRCSAVIRENYDDLFQYRNTNYQISHYPPNAMLKKVSSKTPHTFFTTWETTEAPQAWKARLEKGADRLITTSEWVKEVFIRSLDLQIPIHVVPHGFARSDHDLYQWKSLDTFNFIMVAANPFDARKNGWLAMNAFRAAFPKSEYPDVRLIYKALAPPGVIDFQDDRIMMMQGLFDKSSLKWLYQNSHVLLAPSRGEGFCLPIFEAMSEGVVPLTTDFSTPGSILTEDVAYKIPVRRMVPVGKDFPDNPFQEEFYQGQDVLGEWAEPSFPSMVELMLEAYSNAELKAGLAQDFVRELSIDNMVDKTIEVVTGES